jgi:hypothetical protein
MMATLLRGGLVVLLLLSLPALPRAWADEPTDPDIEKRLADLQRQMDEMRRKHAEETQGLREEIERLKGAATPESNAAESELDRLLRLADEETLVDGIRESPGQEDTNFIARGLGLQALNPEISVTGDLISKFIDPEDEPSETDFFVRGFGIHVDSYLDPYTKMKVAIGVSQEKAALGEGYITRFGILPNVSLTAGKFRQPFGVVNRWHKHALDGLDFPMPLRSIFGDGGLNQTGFSATWSIPEALGASQELTLQLTEGENGRIFGQNSRHLPCALLRYRHFRDLTKDTYLEFGGTGLVGWNDTWDVAGSELRDRRATTVLGADVTLRWEPTDRMRYASFEWRSEMYWLSKKILAPDGSGRDELRAWGAYTSLQHQLSRTLFTGARLDWYAPDSKSYADDAGLSPLAYVGRHPNRWQICPYVTWWQSPFVKAHVEVIWADGHRTGASDLTLALQIVFAAGPHKHERY